MRLQVRRSEERALEFRRGSTPAAITCLAFSPAAVAPRLLACASDHGTVHIFRLQAGGRCGWVGRSAAVPAQLTGFAKQRAGRDA